MIQIGSVCQLSGCSGTVEIVRKSKGGNFFWAKINWPAYKYDGQEAPFSGDGRYLGSVAWALPDLTSTQKLVEVEF